MGYDFIKGEGLCFNRGHKTPLHPCVPEGKNPDYYSKPRHSLGYVSSKAQIDVLQECYSKSIPLAQLC